MTIFRPRAGQLVWDPATDTWVGQEFKSTGYYRAAQRQANERGDAFWGGAIIGVALAGVLQCVVMMFAFL